jgi:hypothetical protein
MINLIPKLFHLQPPSGAHKIRLDRFSPYFNEYQQRLKSKDKNEFESFFNVRPSMNYTLIYPQTIDPWKISFFYESEPNTEVDNITYDQFNEVIEKWKDSWKRKNSDGTFDLPKLVFKKSLSSGHIIDTRSGVSEVYHLEDNYFEIARILEREPCRLDRIQEKCNLILLDIKNILNDFISNNIVILADHRYMWLPISDKYSEHITLKNNTSALA